MVLECVIVCVNYSDFLSHTLCHNKCLFDRLVVVSDNKDTDTHKVCEYYNVECIRTDVFYDRGDRFNKARGINIGLDKLSKKGWVVHMDADIVLPPLTRSILENLVKDNALCGFGIYSIDRYMVPSFNEWMRYLSAPKPVHEGWVFIHMHYFPIGQRLAEYHSKGYEPIGYFQMWNPEVSGVSKYPDRHDGADRTDVLFTKLWPRRYRNLLPEIICFHLDSDDQHTQGKMGANWNGRKTPYFGPKDDIILPQKCSYHLSTWDKIKIFVHKLFKR